MSFFLAIAGLVMMCVSSFLPWASVGPFTMSGTEADGILTLLASLAALGALVGGHLLRAPKIGGPLATVLAAGATLIFVYDLVDVANVVASDEAQFFEPSVGSGLVLGTLAGVGTLVVLVTYVALSLSSDNTPTT